MQHLSLSTLWRREFAGYNYAKFRQDLLAGLHVGAVAVPLALAFGVASGATVSAGLVTSILSGLIIGALSGAPYQISGATAAMSAVLVLLSRKYGIESVWLVGVFSGLLLLLLGLLRLGRFIGFIPTPIITGFTTGIAVIIFGGQINNLFAITLPTIQWGVLSWLEQFLSHESPLIRLLSYLQFNYTINWISTIIGLVMMGAMLFWPAKLGKYLPGSLAGIIIVTFLTWAAGFNIPLIGDIPRTILLADRLHWNNFEWNQIQTLAMPILSVTLLSATISLRCGAAASKIAGIRLQTNPELIAQGIGNIIIPFFGGIPSTGAATRTLVGIKAGGTTRVVSFIHSALLLFVMLIFAPLLGQIPMAAVAGVLMVTAWQMNDWESIRSMFAHRNQSGLGVFILTVLVSISVDLTLAILIGAAISAFMIIHQLTNLEIDIQKVDLAKLKKRGITLKSPTKGVRVAYLTGPIVFAATNQLSSALSDLESEIHTLILSMRAVPLIDPAGIDELRLLHEVMAKNGKTLALSGVQPQVMKMIEQAGLQTMIGAKNFHWSADLAILEADRHKNRQPVEEIEPGWNGSTALALFRPSQPTKEKLNKKRK